MVQNETNKKTDKIDNSKENSTEKTKVKYYNVRLKSVSDVVKAIGKIFNEMRRGDISDTSGQKRAQVLAILLDALRGNEVELRMKEIEAKLAEFRELQEQKLRKAS